MQGSPITENSLTFENPLKNPDNRLRYDIQPEPYPLNPREEFDHLGRIICWHARHNLGDRHHWRTPDEFRAENPDSAILKLRIFLFDHSGLTISTRPFHCPWDSGQVGWIFREKSGLRQEFGCQRLSKRMRQRIFRIFETEVAEYDHFLTGNIWSVTVLDTTGAVRDSIGNVVGYDHAIELAEEMIDSTACY